MLKKLFKKINKKNQTENMDNIIDEKEVTISTEEQNKTEEQGNTEEQAALNNTTSTTPTVSHQFYESSLNILDKINALCSLMASENFPKTLIYCNLPSDTDLVEASLRKRGVATRKLIGNVPHYKVKQSLNLVESGVLSGLIVTDISAKSINPGNFELLICYSVHSDPDIYHFRTTPKGSSKTRRVVSLVSPLDRTHFHYLKKVADFELEKIELNTAQENEESLTRLKLLDKLATSNADKVSETSKSLAKFILESSNKVKIVEYLVGNYTNFGFSAEIDDIINNIQDEPDSDDSVNYNSGNRQNNYGTQNRFNRRERDDSNRDRRGNNKRFGDKKSEPRNAEDSKIDAYSSYSNSTDAETKVNIEETEVQTPKKTVRVYIGKGQSQNITTDIISNFLKQSDQTFEYQRLSVRPNYSFIDLDNSNADKIVEILTNENSPCIGATISKAVNISSRGMLAGR